MRKIFIIAILFFSAFGLKAQSFNSLLASMLQDTLNTYASQITNIKGMSVSVHIPGQGIWTGVYGNSYAGQPITRDMRFGIASNSKLFCSVMMLKLAENKMISLEDSLKKWITITNPNINPNITIRQILNHTSGLSDPFFGPPWMDTILANPARVFTPNEVLGWIGAPLFAAGTGYEYSNTNYVLAGMVAESASGYKLAKLIRDSILTPLNMDSTFLDVEESVNGTLAHRWWNRVINPVTIDYHDTSRVGLNSAVGYAGSIFSTSSELVQWYNALFKGQIINQSSMNQLTTFIATGSPTYKYGLGLSREVTQGYPYWGHGGRTWGYKSKMMYDTCLQVAVAGLSNSDPSGMDGVTFLIYRAVKNHIPGCSGAITGLVSVCRGTNSVTYSVPSIPKATSYSWTLPSGVTGTSTTNSITVNFGIGATSGNIGVTGINNYGSGGSSSISVTVNPLPTVTLSPFKAVCIPALSFVLSGGSPVGGTYSGTGVNTNQFNPTTAGTGSHTITYSFTDNKSCTNTAQKPITVYPKPTVTFSAPPASCVNASPLTLLGGIPSGGIYSGSGVSGSSFNPMNAGIGSHTLKYVYTDANSCMDSNSAIVVVNPLPNLNITGTTVICKGKSTTLAAAATNSSFLWDNNSTNPSRIVSPTSNTSYFVTATHSNSCSKKDSILVTVNPIPPTPMIIKNGNTLTSNALSGNQWYNASGIITGATNSTYIIPSKDNYYCIVTSLGCSSDTSNHINAVLTNINEAFLQNNLEIYPNPSSSNITFQTNLQLNNATLILTDYSGRTVLKINNISGHAFILQRSNLESGLYFAQLVEDNRVIAIKEIVIVD